jgi:cyclophilin family peptidyl-prolyl cis-trans isomerase
MKKLLGIVVLGLLFAANALAENFIIMETSQGKVVIELFRNKAPNHVERIKTLSRQGLYNGVAFHRVIDGFMAQTGDVKFGNYNSKYFNINKAGMGGSDLPDLKQEFNSISHKRGIVSMARASNPNSANSQFFIMLEDGSFLDRQYTVFGKVVSGMEFVDKIKKGTGKNGEVSNPDRIISMTVKGDYVAEKPKEEKPKSTPDDDKIVPAGSGSGFFVSKDGHVITNYHVIEGCDINKLSFKGSQTEVKVLAVDKVNDIAILKSNAKPEIVFPVSNEDVSLLEDVIVAGFPLGKQISSAIKTHKGVVTALAGAGDNYSFFQTDAAINQGNSGGPIINQKGNVVGIAVATWVEEGVQGVHFGIKSSTLKTFASANDLSFASPNYRELSNKDLGKLITKGTVYVECHMTVAKIKKMIAQAENRKAFFKEHK